MTFNNLRPGKSITFLVSNGIGRHGIEYKEKRGRVVMALASHVVVNGGGRHGTPHVVNEKNFVK